MPEKKRFAVTTPIYYVNSTPHLGHTYTTLIADAFARYYRQRGYEVLFATGCDEHGEKVQKAAQARKVSEQEYVDKMAALWKAEWEALSVTYTDFIRTTEPRHRTVVQRVLTELKANGTVSPYTYAGWYCVPCESFFKEEDLGRDKTCPNEWCQRAVEWVKEEGYAFALSRFQEPLLRHYREHPEEVLPSFRANEVISFIEGGLKDIYITRASLHWGIPVPFAPHLATYVWFDALLNYLTVCQYTQNEEFFSTFWPVDCHFIAKDILRFHAIIWPAMLMALKLPLPRRIVAHGFWKMHSEKMSKSKGNFITAADARRLLQEREEVSPPFSTDALRYYLLAETPLGQDGQFQEGRFLERYESDLADNLGNLVQRLGKMLLKYQGGRKKKRPTEPLAKKLFQAEEEVQKKMEQFELQGAVRALLQLSTFLNQTVEKSKPWTLKDNPQALATSLADLTGGVKALTYLLSPFLPAFSQRAAELLGFSFAQAETLREALRTKERDVQKNLHPIFPKAKKEVTVESKSQEAKISIQEFARLDLRIARILQAERIASADKLLKLILEVGSEQVQVVAGLAPHYTPEELVGKLVVLCKNLAPATLRGVESSGMILAADFEGVPILLTPEKPVQTGTQVR